MHPPFDGWRQVLARVLAVLWLIAGIWIGALLLMYLAMGGDGPSPGPEAAYLGLTATVYHLVGLYGGLLLVLLSAFAPQSWWAAFSRGGGTGHAEVV